MDGFLAQNKMTQQTFRLELGDFPMAMYIQCIQDSLVCYYLYPFMIITHILDWSAFPVMLYMLYGADNV